MWHQPDTRNRYYFEVESPAPEKTRRQRFWHVTLYELLTILCAAAIPVAVGVYTAVEAEQSQRQADQTRSFDLKQAAELRQQDLYDKFLDNIYNLDKDKYLDEDKTPWALANAYFRAAHRQWDALRKADVLRFLMEKRLIGRRIEAGRSFSRQLINIIRLNELNFDHIYVKSSTDSLNQLNLKNVEFDQVSLTNAAFLFVDLDSASFIDARLNSAKFRDSSLTYALFERTQLKLTDFGNCNLTGAQFIDVDLSTAKLTPDQISQLSCINTILPNKTICNTFTMTTRTTPATEWITDGTAMASTLNDSTSMNMTIATTEISVNRSVSTNDPLTTNNNTSTTTTLYTSDFHFQSLSLSASESTITSSNEFSNTLETSTNP